MARLRPAYVLLALALTLFWLTSAADAHGEAPTTQSSSALGRRAAPAAALAPLPVAAAPAGPRAASAGTAPGLSPKFGVGIGLAVVGAFAIPVGVVFVANTNAGCPSVIGSSCETNPELGFVGVSVSVAGLAALTTGVTMAIVHAP